MYLGNGPPRRQRGSNPIRVLILLALISGGLYVLTVRPESIPQPFQPTPTPTRTAVSFVTEGVDYYRTGNLGEGIKSYELAIRSDPTIVENYILLIKMLIYQHRFEEALDYVNTALFVNPDYGPAHAVKALALDWKSAQLYDEGLDNEAEDLLIEALGEANKAVEKDPTSADAYAYLAEILFDLGNYNQATEAIDTALQLDENSLAALRVAGYLNELRGFRDEAIERYSAALKIHPNLAILHHALGRTYIGAGDVNSAIESLQRALSLDPGNAEYLYWIGYAYFTIGERELAADFFEQAIESRPTYPAAHCQLGLIYYQQRNWEGAIPELETGVEGYGDRITFRNAFCYYTLGLSYFYLARCEEAYPLFDQVLLAIPENQPSLEGIRLCREAGVNPPTGPPTPAP